MPPRHPPSPAVPVASRVGARDGARSERLERRTTADLAAAFIRTRILDGSLPRGARVPQDDVAAELGVSRIPVREALIALEREGWVTIEAHRGAFVNPLDAAVVREHFALFGLLYGFAARRLAERADPEAIAEIRDLERQLASADDPDEVERLAIAFHAAVVSGSRSRRLKVLLRAMSSIVPGNVFALLPETVATEKRGQAAIVRALLRADGARAAAEYERMMRRIGEQVVAMYRERGALGS